jgi:hypothetical protein
MVVRNRTIMVTDRVCKSVGVFDNIWQFDCSREVVIQIAEFVHKLLKILRPRLDFIYKNAVVSWSRDTLTAFSAD